MTQTSTYDLCIWDPARPAALPATHHEALDIMERLSLLNTPADDVWRATLAEFASLLVQRYEVDKFNHAGSLQHNRSGGLNAFWGSDPRKGAAECKTAVYRLALPGEPCLRQIAYAVEVAAGLGLVVFDDDNGMCFLPDGKILPEDVREMWESNLADLKAGLPDPSIRVPDGRNIWQRIAGDLFDTLGR